MARLLAWVMAVAVAVGVTFDFGLASARGAVPVSRVARVESLEAVQAMSAAEASERRPCVLRTTVTFCRPEWGMLFVWSDTAGTYVRIPLDGPQLIPGDEVELVGVTRGDRGYPELADVEVRPTGGRRWPIPVSPWKESDLFPGDPAISARWIEVNGTVVGGGIRAGRAAMHLRMGAHTLEVVMREMGTDDIRRWLGADVAVSGVAALVYDGSGKLSGVSLLADHRSQVRIRQAPARSWLDQPVVPVAQVKSVAADHGTHRVRLHGVVLQRLAPDRFLLRDSSGEIEVRTAHASDEPLEFGVEVLGMARLGAEGAGVYDAAVLSRTLPDPVTSREARAAGGAAGELGLPVLRDAASVQHLTRSEAARGYPVRFEAVVTYCDPEWWLLFVQDATDGLFVAPRQSGVRLTHGQRVEVSGRTAPGAFSPMVAEAEFSLRGMAPLPAPVEVEAERVHSGRYDAHWVRMKGTIQSVRQDGARATLYLRTGTRTFPVTLVPPTDPARAGALVDARVTVEGVVAGVVDGEGGQVGERLHVPDLGFVRVDVPASVDRFEGPVRPMGDLFRGGPAEREDRVLVSGVVTLISGDGDVVVEDDTGGVFVRPGEPATGLAVGDRVAVSGYPAADGDPPSLREARWKRLGSGVPRVAVVGHSGDLLGGRHSARLVKLAGRVVQTARLVPGGVVALGIDGALGSVVLPVPFVPGGGTGKEWHAGTEVEVTGVCLLRRGQAGQARSFEILVRDAGDLRVTGHPSFLSRRQGFWLLAGASGMALVGALVAGLVTGTNRKLRAAEDRVRTILAHVQTGILVVEPGTGKVTYSNPVARSMLGRDEWEVAGERIGRLLAGAALGFAGATPEGDRAGEEDALLRSDGTRLPVLRNVVPIELGGERRMLVSFVDVSERHEAQAALQRAKVAAEAASEAKSRFLALMSHEIRTPLKGVVGVLHMLTRESPSPRQERLIRMALQASDTLLRVIGDFLDFSKIEAGKLELQIRSFDLPAAVSGALAPFAASAQAKGLKWSLDVGPSVPRCVRGDPERIAQILANLAGNAVKFTDHGGVEVLLETVPGTGGPGPVRVRLSVSDTGIGISEEQQKLLFQPFSQVDSSAARRFSGTGLGLGICRELAELMGGGIGLVSQPGSGSRFWVELPLERVPSAGGHAEAPTQPGEPAWGGPGEGAAAGIPAAPDEREGGRRRRVLLVEDNEINREIAREMILAAGCDCDWVGDGQSAIRSVQEGHYDLVFMDCMMPITDGYTASRAIRSEEARHGGSGVGRRVPIVAMTANAMKGDRERCLEAGMDDYLSKPLDPEEVIAAIGRWTAVSRGRVPEVRAGRGAPG